MRSTDELVTAIRADTRNNDVPNGLTSTIGIETSDIVRFLNHALESYQSIVLKANPVAFRETYSFNTVAGQEAYTIADRVYAQERIVSAQISRTGQTTDLVPLPEKGIQYRRTVNGDPTYYIRSGNGALWLNPIAQSTTPLVRVTFQRQLDTLAIRNGIINGTPSGASIVLSSPTAAEEAFFTANTYICVSDFEGNVLLRNGKIASYNAGSDTITLAANVSTYLVGTYTLANLASAYVTIGRYTTTHAKIPDNHERYLHAYGCMDVLARDSSNDVSHFKGVISEVKAEIRDIAQDSQQDEANVQICNEDLILNDGW